MTDRVPSPAGSDAPKQLPTVTLGFCLRHFAVSGDVGDADRVVSHSYLTNAEAHALLDAFLLRKPWSRYNA